MFDDQGAMAIHGPMTSANSTKPESNRRQKPWIFAVNSVARRCFINETGRRNRCFMTTRRLYSLASGYGLCSPWEAAIKKTEKQVSNLSIDA
jgi:hypothetical protein